MTMRSPRSVRFLACGVAVISALAGAGQGQPAATFDLPEGVGREQVTNACTACHGIDQVVAQRRSAAQWSATVDQMVARGAAVTDADFPVIVAYLARHFGESPQVGDAPPAPAAPR